MFFFLFLFFSPQNFVMLKAVQEWRRTTLGCGVIQTLCGDRIKANEKFKAKVRPMTHRKHNLSGSIGVATHKHKQERADLTKSEARGTVNRMTMNAALLNSFFFLRKINVACSTLIKMCHYV